MREDASVPDDAAMPVLAAARPSRAEHPLLAAALAVAVGLFLVGGGLLLGYVTFASGIVERFMSPRPGPTQAILGAAAWAVALVVPAIFVIVGTLRLVSTLDDLVGSRPKPRPATRIADRLPADHVVASRVRLPDGRLVPELVVGPFGVAVIEELPPLAGTRRRDGHWEARMVGGRWQPIEHPIDRATRDLERVRRWLMHEDHDHVVRVWAALVAPEGAIARTPDCAVVTPEQLTAWLAGLPPQRSLNADRRAQIVELLQGAMA